MVIPFVYAIFFVLGNGGISECYNGTCFWTSSSFAKCKEWLTDLFAYTDIFSFQVSTAGPKTLSENFSQTHSHFFAVEKMNFGRRAFCYRKRLGQLLRKLLLLQLWHFQNTRKYNSMG